MSKRIDKKRELDENTCKWISKSISEILKFSFNEEFRNRSFKLFGVLSSSQMEKEIFRKLLKIIKTAEGNFLMQEDKKYEPCEYTTEKNELYTLNAYKINPSDENSVYDNCSSTNPHKRSWLQISSERCKESLDSMQCKKLRYYSQPDTSVVLTNYEKFTQSYKNADEFYNLKNFKIEKSFAHEISQVSSSDLTKYNVEANNHDKIKYKKVFEISTNYFSRNSKTNNSCYF